MHGGQTPDGQRFELMATALTRAFQHRPLHIRLLNRFGSIGRNAECFGQSLDAAQLLEQARKRTGLDDFGVEDFVEPLRRLIDSYNSEARLNFVGWLAARSHLLQLLENRLRIEHDRKQHSQIADQEIHSPVVILGLPRTGSTLLFELMGQNPEFRSPLSWEVMLPSPPPRVDTFHSDARIARVRRLLGFVDRLAPDFQRIHPVGAGLPQECLPMLAQAFRSLQFHTTHNVPGYQAWLDAADLTPGYSYHRRMLQQFQAFGPRGIWLLKAPAHLFGIDALFRVYPDARIIQTHRDPVKVVGSICSHCATLRQAFSDHLDLADIGSTWCKLWSSGLQKAIRFRRDHPELAERFLDVYYEDLQEDPMAAVRRVYRHLGLGLGSQAVRIAHDHLKEHPQNAHGVHSYRVEDFGLAPDAVRACFDGYTGRRAQMAVAGVKPAAVPPPAYSLA